MVLNITFSIYAISLRPWSESIRHWHLITSSQWYRCLPTLFFLSSCVSFLYKVHWLHCLQVDKEWDNRTQIFLCKWLTWKLWICEIFHVYRIDSLFPYKSVYKQVTKHSFWFMLDRSSTMLLGGSKLCLKISCHIF